MDIQTETETIINPVYQLDSRERSEDYLFFHFLSIYFFFL